MGLFPRPTGRGLIEANTHWERFALADRHEFPRPTGRGLIEAEPDAIEQFELDADFRDQLVAASLKLGMKEPDAYSLMEFPRPTGRGLIEAGVNASDAQSPDTDFRDQLVAASLKLGAVRQHRGAVGISATNWSRPH